VINLVNGVAIHMDNAVAQEVVVALFVGHWCYVVPFLSVTSGRQFFGY
jgi:hypothetical protein